ncbi:MAG: 1-(5-phosphoribosyl)-5-[(5-phosphoribosylamino)methylideneamino] imidazole-4-carboxamide isomerase [bacterium]
MQKLLVIPSIDIKDGKTVRVVQGIPELNSTEYGNDAVEMAMIWRTENAKCIHVVDFDAVHEHSHRNFNVIKEICESVIVPIEMGGGILNFDDAQTAFDIGVFRIVIGSMTFDNQPEFEKILNYFGPKKVAAAIDVVNNSVVIHGRHINTNVSVLEHAANLKSMGVERIIITDVSRNGMMTGPNVYLCVSVAQHTGCKITLSGGVGGFEDLMKVQAACIDGIDSVIIGRALYENKFSCQKIWRVAESGIF